MNLHQRPLAAESYWGTDSCGTTRTDETKYSLKYFEDVEEFRYEHEPFIHSFAQFTRWNGKRILEVGAGAGTDFLQFVRAGAKAHCVDLTEEAIRNIRLRLELYGLRAEEIRSANAEQIPYEDNSFDLVYSWGVIHHADDMEKAFSEIYRVTKPGGRIKIMVYNLHAVHTWYMYLRYALLRGKAREGRRWAIYHYQESFGTKVYSKSDIIHLLGRYGHSNLRFTFYDQRIRRGAQLGQLRRAVQRLTPPSMRWYMAFELDKCP